MTTPLIDAGFRDRADKTLPCRHCGGRAAIETYDHHRKDGSWRVEITRCYLPNRKDKDSWRTACPTEKTETRIEEIDMTITAYKKVAPTPEQIALVEGLPIARGAFIQFAGVSRDTMYRWLRGEAIGEALHRQIIEAAASTMDEVKEISEAAVEVAKCERARREAELEEARAEYLATKDQSLVETEGPKIDHISDQFDNLKAELKDAQHWRDVYQSDSKAFSKSIDELGAELAKTRAERDELQACNSTQELMIVGLKENVERLSDTLRETIQQRDNTFVERESFRKQMAEATEEVEQLKTQHERRERLFQENHARLSGEVDYWRAEAQKAVDKLRAEREAIAAEIDDLSATFQDFTPLLGQHCRLDDIIDRLKRIWAENIGLEAEVARLARIVERNREDRGSGAMDAICQQRDELIREKNELENALEGYKGNYVAAGDAYRLTLAERDDLASKNVLLRGEISGLKSRIANSRKNPNHVEIMGYFGSMERPVARQLCRTIWSTIDLLEMLDQQAKEGGR